MNKITKKTINEWKKTKLVKRAYMVLKKPVPLNFKKETIFRQLAIIDELFMSGDLLKQATATRNCWQMYISSAKKKDKNLDHEVWQNQFFKTIKYFRHIVSLVEDINENEAYIRVLSKLTGKSELKLTKEHEALKNKK